MQITSSIYNSLFANNTNDGEENDPDEQYSPIDAIFER